MLVHDDEMHQYYVHINNKLPHKNTTPVNKINNKPLIEPTPHEKATKMPPNFILGYLFIVLLGVKIFFVFFARENRLTKTRWG